MSPSRLYFALDIKAVDRALETVNRFNELNIVNKTVKINVPSVWMFDKTASRAGPNPFQVLSVL